MAPPGPETKEKCLPPRRVQPRPRPFPCRCTPSLSRPATAVNRAEASDLRVAAGGTASSRQRRAGALPAPLSSAPPPLVCLEGTCSHGASTAGRERLLSKQRSPDGTLRRALGRYRTVQGSEMGRVCSETPPAAEGGGGQHPLCKRWQDPQCGSSCEGGCRRAWAPGSRQVKLFILDASCSCDRAWCLHTAVHSAGGGGQGD